LVRETWVKYCLETGDTKPSHITPYDELSEWDKEADRRIGEAIFAAKTAGAETKFADRFQTYVPGTDDKYHIADDNGGTLCGIGFGDGWRDCICDTCETLKEQLLNPSESV
jgi:hypothetical protein